MRTIFRTLVQTRHHVGFAIFFIVVGVGLVFADASQGGFLRWDDDINLTENPHIRGTDFAALKWMFSDFAYMRRYVPLAWLNWALEYRWFGLNAWSAHIGNILLHATNAVLVFLIARFICLHQGTSSTSRKEISSRLATWTAAVSAALWAVHPLRVEPVAWASGRIYCVAAFFLLLSTLAYLHATRTPMSRSTRIRWWALVTGAYAASLLTYPLGITFVGAVLILDIWVLRRFEAAGSTTSRFALVMEKLPLAALALGCGLITVWARLRAAGEWDPPPTLAEFGVLARIAQAGYVWFYYVWKPFLPLDLSPVYTSLIHVDVWAPRFVVSALAILGLTALLVWKRRDWPGVFALWMIHLCVLIPVLGLTESPHYTNDRYSYLGHVPWMIGVGCLFARLIAHLPRPRADLLSAVAGTLIITLAVLATRQIPVWRDSKTLFLHMISRLGDHPSRANIHRRLGDWYRDQAHLTDAHLHYAEAVRANPYESFAHFGQGLTFEGERRWSEAAAAYRVTIGLRPDFAPAHLRLGHVEYQSNRLDEALDAFRSAGLLMRDKFEAHMNIAAVLLRMGKATEALPHCEAAVRLQPKNRASWLNLGSALAGLSRHSEAIAAYETALRQDSEYYEAHYILGLLLRRLGQTADADRHLLRALEIKPDLVPAREALGLKSP